MTEGRDSATNAHHTLSKGTRMTSALDREMARLKKMGVTITFTRGHHPTDNDTPRPADHIADAARKAGIYEDKKGQ